MNFNTILNSLIFVVIALIKAVAMSAIQTLAAFILLSFFGAIIVKIRKFQAARKNTNSTTRLY